MDNESVRWWFSNTCGSIIPPDKVIAAHIQSKGQGIIVIIIIIIMNCFTPAWHYVQGGVLSSHNAMADSLPKADQLPPKADPTPPPPTQDSISKRVVYILLEHFTCSKSIRKIPVLLCYATKALKNYQFTTNKN